MSKLIRLADGNWVDPAIVVAVKAHGASRCDVTGCLHPSRVVVHTRESFGTDGPIYIILCESWEDAETIRDDVARQCNEARSAPSRPGD